MTVGGSDTVCNPQLRLRVRKECAGKLCVHRNGLLAKPRKFTMIPGFTQDHNLGVYNNCVDTVERAFTERYFMCQTPEGFRPALPVSPRRFDDDLLLSEFRAWTLAFTPKLPVMTYQQTVDLFPASKRKVYEEAWESLSRKGPVCARDAHLTSFVKFEKQDIVKAPRVINPRSARFNLEVARFLKHLEHLLFKSMHKAFGLLWPDGHARSKATVFKGMDADQSAACLRDKWEAFSDPVAIGLDARKFDMHVSTAALKYEHSFYNLYWKNPFLRWLLRKQLYNKGKARCKDGTVEFEMRGTRTSGDINTSLGNCILMCSMVWAFCSEHHVRCELANNGDDCVLIVERSDLHKLDLIKEHFVSLGFDVVLEEPVYEFEKIEFCQTHPVKLSTGWRMVRNPFTCFRKDTMCLRPMANDGTFRKWLGAVASAGTSLCAGVPVLENFYKCLGRRGIESTKFGDLISPYRFARTSSVRATLCDEARVSFAIAYDITPSEQVLMEELFDSIDIGELDLSVIERSALTFGLPGAQILRDDIYSC